MLWILKYLFWSDVSVFIIVSSLYIEHLSFYSTPKDCIKLLERKSSSLCPFLHTGHTSPQKKGGIPKSVGRNCLTRWIYSGCFNCPLSDCLESCEDEDLKVVWRKQNYCSELSCADKFPETFLSHWHKALWICRDHEGESQQHSVQQIFFSKPSIYLNRI